MLCSSFLTIIIILLFYISVSRAIVEKHQGSITAHSDGLDQGCTFTIDLPLNEQQAIAPLPSLPQNDSTSYNLIRRFSVTKAKGILLFLVLIIVFSLCVTLVSLGRRVSSLPTGRYMCCLSMTPPSTERC